MPIKMGLAERRRIILEEELKRIVGKFEELDVEKVILFGSLATNNVHKISDIDLIIIKKTDERFLDRLENIYQHLMPEVGMDILVYTPEEFEEVKGKSDFIRSALKNGRVIYEK